MAEKEEAKKKRRLKLIIEDIFVSIVIVAAILAIDTAINGPTTINSFIIVFKYYFQNIL